MIYVGNGARVLTTDSEVNQRLSRTMVPRAQESKRVKEPTGL